MKKLIIIASIVSLALSSCTSTKTVTYNDDVYANPSQDRLEKARLAAEKKKKDEELAKKEAEERAAALAAQKAIDDANPAYKEPAYDKDDYYDYQYASRIRRFNNPVYGVGYYDNYYTNVYMYNGNPAMYGTSIYSSYNYWGPSYNNYGCWPSSYFGVSYAWGYPNYGYNPYPYGGYGYNPYSYSNGYMQGYYNGYNNGYYNGYYGYPYGGYSYGNGWGYYNQFDVNSGYNKPTNGPRGSHDGGNSGRSSNPGVYTNGLAKQYVQEVQVIQAMTPKFDNVSRPTKTNGSYNSNSNSFENVNSGDIKPTGNFGNSNPKNTGVNTTENGGVIHYGGNGGTFTNPKNTSGNVINGTETQIDNGNSNTPKGNTGLTPIKAEPVKPVRNYTPIETNTPKSNIFESTKPNLNNGGNNNPPPVNTSPRGGGSGGGGNRPR